MDYSLDKNDLMTTAVITNTAFQLAIRTQTKFSQRIPIVGTTRTFYAQCWLF
jgi:hypothetical protein